MPLAFREAIPLPTFVLAAIFILVSFLMVSTIRYSKPQVTMVRRFSRGRMVVVALFLIVSLIYIGYRYGFDFAAAGLFTIVVIYIISGLIILVIQGIQELRM
jgi:CDP-diacylglycerol---serine O-phosphatidyltransferase